MRATALLVTATSYRLLVVSRLSASGDTLLDMYLRRSGEAHDEYRAYLATPFPDLAARQPLPVDLLAM